MPSLGTACRPATLERGRPIATAAGQSARGINQTFSLLDVDQDNADDLLLLQLACRARGLA